MAISINWNTSVIYIPKIDSTQIQPSPEIREIGANAIHLALRSLESSEEGIPFKNTHSHNTEVLLSGVTYARTITILPPYTIEFEDGQYQINITGANHNFGDVKVVNQVSLLIGNSAGLTTFNLPSEDVTLISSAVWNRLASDHTVDGSVGFFLNLIKAYLTNKMDIDEANSRIIVYDDAGTTPLYYNIIKDKGGANIVLTGSGPANRLVRT